MGVKTPAYTAGTPTTAEKSATVITPATARRPPTAGAKLTARSPAIAWTPVVIGEHFFAIVNSTGQM